VKVARELGFKGPIFTLEVFLSSFFKVAGEKAAEGVLLNMFPAPPTQLAKKISDVYRAKYNEEMTPLAMQHYQAAWIFKTAAEKADSIEPEKMMPVMEKMEFREKSVFGGTLKFSGRDVVGIDRRISMPMGISMIKNGKLELQEIAEMLPGF
jgi:ABC-type branched-subunit amino acid transport system substrate-binding protein